MTNTTHQQPNPIHTPNLAYLTHLRETNPRFYISGPISGHADLNAPAFEKEEANLKAHGIVPINPLKVVDLSVLRPMTPDEEWAYCMKADLKEMYTCGALVMLNNWRKSIGASWEFLNAKVLGIPTLTLDYEPEVLTKAEYVDLFFNVMSKIKRADDNLRTLLVKNIGV